MPCAWESLHTDYIWCAHIQLHNSFYQLPGIVGATISNAGQFKDHVPILWPHGVQRIETHDEERCNAGGRLGQLIAISEFTSFSVVSSSYSLEVMCWIGSHVLVVSNLVRIPAMSCALNACTRNSSPTLNTLTALSTFVRCMISRRLHKEPGCDGVPQNIVKITFRHSHRK